MRLELFPRHKFMLNILALAAAFTVASPASAALNGYMTAEGSVQGQFKGDVTVAPHEETMAVLKYSLGTNTPYDPATGLPTDGNQFRPVRVLKRVDQSSPLFVNAMAYQENLSSVQIEFYRPSRTGAEEHFYTLELLNAQVVGITQFQGSLGDDQSLPKLEWIELTFQKMIQTYEDGGITAEDNWATPTN